MVPPIPPLEDQVEEYETSGENFEDTDAADERILAGEPYERDIPFCNW